MKNFVIYTAIVLPLLIFGCCAGSLAPFVLEKSLEKSYDGWVLLKSPPENIKRLQAANFYTIYAETNDGKLISCRYESALDFDCWNEVSEIPKIEETDKCYDFPSTPSKIRQIDRIDFGACIPFAGMEGYSFSSYVLSDDGQVYLYSVGSPSIISLKFIRTQILFSLAGSIIGLVFAFIIVVIYKKKNTFMAASG
jgi:hypothetical protein